MAYSVNKPCPCHSGKKYKKCCLPYHKGMLPQTAKELMHSRYCAYALHLSNYIIHTTHPQNPDFQEDTKTWATQIDAFTHATTFVDLEILGVEESEKEAFVTFKATFQDSTMREKSRFFKVEGKWLYHSGEFNE